MKKDKSPNFYCKSCEHLFIKWAGRCDVCEGWNTIEPIDKHDGQKNSDAMFVPISQQQAFQEQRYKTGIDEFDRVCGGGLVEGSIILLAGEPGIGKSTLLLQVLAQVGQKKPVYYISAEESVQQVQGRFSRLSCPASDDIYLSSSSDLDKVLGILKTKKPGLVIIDSIQTMFSQKIDATIGSMAQIRVCTMDLMAFAKSSSMTVIIVGHVTKDGQLAGPKLLEHMVDTVLYFEGDRHYDFRLLRTLKNRFGPTDEMGVFRMQDQGLVEIANPSELFLSNGTITETGCSIFASLEGMRPILCEVQTLVTDTAFGIAKRTCVGFDMNRLSMILAILDSRLKMSLSQKDVYLNVAGGLKITEPSADLAVAASLISSYQKKPAPKGIFFGELSLSGHLRPVRRPYLRLQEAERLNLKQAYIPKQTEDKQLKNLTVIELASIQDYIKYLHSHADDQI